MFTDEWGPGAEDDVEDEEAGLDLEQSIPATHTSIIQHERSRNAGGLPVT
ncbi:hypothetical protein ACH4PR_47985 [Streptomyces mirabilis]